ncbi:MAG: hypothetical protein JST54_24575 [Deltaproteobacteria bacterium]|nr:hypothetical protein [Deltaproteobacteria bacterium]
MRDSPTTLEGLEVGALAVDRRVDEQVSRCLAVLQDPVALRQELGGLAGMKSQRAEFAFCLFSLDLAKLGESEARANFARHAGILLEAHRDPDLTRYLLGDNADLTKRWEDFVPLLLEFDKAQKAQVNEAAAPLEAAFAAPPPSSAAVTLPPTAADMAQMEGPPRHATFTTLDTAESEPQAALDGAVDACFAARGTITALGMAMDALFALPRSERVDFAVCLFELELVRMGVEDAKGQFAARTELLLSAYRDRLLAQRLIGSSAGLKALWADLVPYLEEFFEGPDDEYEIVEEEAVAAEEVHAADDLGVAEEPEQPLIDAAIVEEPPPESVEGLEVEVLEEVPAGRAKPPPPPKPSPTPVPGRIPAHTPGKGVTRRSSVSGIKRPAPPPPPPAQEFAAPSPETLAFWAHTEKALNLLPDESGMLSGLQAFSLGSRDARTRLKHFAREVVTRFPSSPEARAAGCMVELYLATHQKEKTLFGKPNEKRQEAIQDALALLSGDAVAAANAAVLFENDGPETIAQFAQALEALHKYLGFCFRKNLDPLKPETVQQFK